MQKNSNSRQSATGRSQRLFFALWPDRQVRLALLQRYADLDASLKQGRPLDMENLHMTLHYLGNTTATQKDCFIAQSRGMVCKPFTVELNQFGFFPRAAVSWIAPTHAPPALLNLYQDMAVALASCGYVSEQRPYQPHITMARKVKCDQQARRLEPINWVVDDFVLVQSVSTGQGVQYRVLDRFGK